MKVFAYLKITLFLLLFISRASAQPGMADHSIDTREKFELSGTVTDASGESLPGASVFIHDINRGVIADAKGHYRLANIPQGTYLVEVSFTGYRTISVSVSFTQDIRHDFILNPAIVESQAVIVTGVSSATLIRKSPVPVNIIKKENLFRGISGNIIDALSKTPGVAQITTGPAISKPSIRGLGYNRVVVVNDGVRMEGQQWGDEHGIEIDEFNVSKVEVLKGPSSIMYGSDALAGVINIISVNPPPENSIRGNVFGTYQTNNAMQGLHADLSGNQNGFIWGIYGSEKTASDYKNRYDGYVYNSRFRELDGGAYAGVNRSWGFSHLILSNFDQQLGLIEGDRDLVNGKFLKLINNNGIEEQVDAEDHSTSTQPGIPRQHISHFKLISDNSFNIGQDRLSLNIGYQRNRRQEFGNIVNPRETELYFDLATVTYDLKYLFHERNNWKTSVGISGMYQTNGNKGIEQLIPDYELSDAGGFVFTQKSTGKTTFSGGLRFDHRHIDSEELVDGSDIKFEGFTRNFSNISASAGISFEASDKLTLKFNVSRGFRAPVIPELASNGAHEGTNRYEYGNRNLRSENSLQIDAGLEVDAEHLSLTSTFFYNHIDHFVYYRKLPSANGGDSIVTDGINRYMAFKFDQDNAALYGAEITLDIHPHPLDWLHFENIFSYVRGQLSRANDGSRNLPFIPPPKLVNELRGNFFSKGKRLKNLYVKIELENNFAQNNAYTGYNTETATSAYSLLNAGVGTDFVHKGKTMFSLYLGASNLTDVAYQNHLSRLKYLDENPLTGRTGVFNMGRNFSIKLNLPIAL